MLEFELSDSKSITEGLLSFPMPAPRAHSPRTYPGPAPFHRPGRRRANVCHLLSMKPLAGVPIRASAFLHGHG